MMADYTHINVISFTPIRKEWPSLHQFSCDPQMVNCITFRSLILDFTQGRQ